MAIWLIKDIKGNFWGYINFTLHLMLQKRKKEKENNTNLAVCFDRSVPLIG